MPGSVMPRTLAPTHRPSSAAQRQTGAAWVPRALPPHSQAHAAASTPTAAAHRPRAERRTTAWLSREEREAPAAHGATP